MIIMEQLTCVVLSDKQIKLQNPINISINTTTILEA